MSLIDPSWTKWIILSIHNHFVAALDTKVDLLVEGVDGWNDTVLDTTHVELRTSGPHYNELAKEQWIVKVAVNLLYSSPLGRHLNVYEDIGLLQQICSDRIKVYRYGDKVTDDKSFFGELDGEVAPVSKPVFKTHDLAQIGESTDVHQVIVSVVYEMYINFNSGC